mmetsp:Transcript_143155/g.363365  ORF Transcript_143155/g.363365 Transcript_143155/m.363365 type:complete len:263 (-) Transcript_143155:113-901(-)
MRICHGLLGEVVEVDDQELQWRKPLDIVRQHARARWKVDTEDIIVLADGGGVVGPGYGAEEVGLGCGVFLFLKSALDPQAGSSEVAATAIYSAVATEEEEDEEEGRVNTAGSTSRFDVMDPSDFRVPVETSLAVSLLGTAGRIPSASSSGLAAPAGCGGFQAAAAAPLPSPRLAAPSTVASTSDETSTCSPTSSGGEASFAPTRSPSLSEESSCAESGTAALPGGYLQSMITAKLGEWAEQIFGQPAKAVAVARAAPLEEAC